MRNSSLLLMTIYWGSPCGLDILTKIQTKIFQTKIHKQLFFIEDRFRGQL